MVELKDPIGKAIADFSKGIHEENIIVRSELCDDDVIPVEYLFRTFEEMPKLEKEALNLCKGYTLDVGAAAGIHARELINRGIEVKAIDTSFGSTEYLNSLGINAKQINFFDLKDEKFDTILLLMNGIGIAGELTKLPYFLNHCKSLLAPGGKVICDTTDIKYLYENEDGSLWVDLASEYYGNFRYQMVYKDQETNWFDWLYLDQDTFRKYAEEANFKFRIVDENEDEYLVELTLAE